MNLNFKKVQNKEFVVEKAFVKNERFLLRKMPQISEKLKITSFYRFSCNLCTISEKNQKLEASKHSKTNELAMKHVFLETNKQCFASNENDLRMSKNWKSLNFSTFLCKMCGNVSKDAMLTFSTKIEVDVQLAF